MSSPNSHGEVFNNGSLPHSSPGDVDGIDDEGWHFLSQPFYPSPEPSLDDVLPLSPNDLPLSDPPLPLPSCSPNGQPKVSLFVDYTGQGSSIVETFENPELLDDSVDKQIAGRMQRSLSSQCLEESPQAPCGPFLFHTRFCSPHLDIGRQPLRGSDWFCRRAMRKACSTGDLQMMAGIAAKGYRNEHLSSSSTPSCREEEEEVEEDAMPTSSGSLVVARYSAEERKHRIHRYRTKRNNRNFNKTIKYACRKTLADCRPRVRGRFAKNDDAGGELKVAAAGSSVPHNFDDVREECFLDGEE